MTVFHKFVENVCWASGFGQGSLDHHLVKKNLKLGKNSQDSLNFSLEENHQALKSFHPSELHALFVMSLTTVTPRRAPFDPQLHALPGSRHASPS
jgi:hypothetical protein